MSKISDERLDELIAAGETNWHSLSEDDRYKIIALRELRDYRKAVREYLEADSSLYVVGGKIVSKRAAAEATLRAVQERT